MFIILFIPISIQLVMSSSKFIVKVALDIGGAFFEVEQKIVNGSAIL